MLNEILSKFKCTQNEDIENFLQNKAVLYSNRGWCYTYLIINRDKLEQGIIFVEGYFTLSVKVITLSKEVSNSKKKKIFNGLKKKDNFIPVILIGQLGKYIVKYERK